MAVAAAGEVAEAVRGQAGEGVGRDLGLVWNVALRSLALQVDQAAPVLLESAPSDVCVESVAHGRAIYLRDAPRRDSIAAVYVQQWVCGGCVTVTV